MSGGGRLALALLATIAASPAAADPIPPTAVSPNEKPDTLCGITADKVKDFEAKVAADKRFRPDQKTDRLTAFASDQLQALWTFATPRNPAHPAGICREVIDRGGVMALEMRIRCEASPAACEGFYAEQKRLDDNSGD
jgi:hypothetical protein